MIYTAYFLDGPMRGRHVAVIRPLEVLRYATATTPNLNWVKPGDPVKPMKLDVVDYRLDGPIYGGVCHYRCMPEPAWESERGVLFFVGDSDDANLPTYDHIDADSLVKGVIDDLGEDFFDQIKSK